MTDALKPGDVGFSIPDYRFPPGIKSQDHGLRKSMSKITYTHILEHYENQRYETLYRASDGMRIGTLSEKTVIFGENPHKCEGRTFVDHESAVKFLRCEVSKRDLPEGTTIQLDVRELHGKVILPAGSMDFPSGMSKFN